MFQPVGDNSVTFLRRPRYNSLGSPRGSQPCVLFLLEPQAVSARIMHPLDIHWIYTFASVALVAGLALVGRVALTLSPKRLSRVIPLLVSSPQARFWGLPLATCCRSRWSGLGMGPNFQAS